jgi:hypothetical protein
MTTPPPTGFRFLQRFFASFENVPTVGLHAATCAFLAVVYVLTLTTALAIGRPVDDAAAFTVGGFVLAYAAKTSYDFAKKRTTEIVRPPEVMASDAAPPAVAQVAQVAAETPAPFSAPLPADLSSALSGRRGASETAAPVDTTKLARGEAD